MRGPAFRPLALDAPDLGPLLLRAALPSVVGLSINAVHQTVDAFFVGMIDMEALAAVSLALPVLGVTAALGVGLGGGLAAVAARRLGAGRPDQAGQAASAVLALALPLAGLVALGLHFGAQPILRTLGAGPGLMPEAAVYLRIMAVCAGLGILQIIADFIAIAEGNARFSMMTLLLCFGLNIVLDPLLIFGAGLGVAGAALATAVAQFVTLAVYGWYFAARIGRVHPTLAGARAGMRHLRGVLSLGIPQAGASLLSALGMVLIYRAAGAHAGPAGLAAIGIALRVLMLGTLPLTGFCLGAQAVLAHAAGAGDGARLHRALMLLVRHAAGFAALYAAIAIALARPIAGAFTADPQVAMLAAGALVVVLPPLPLGAAQLATLAYLQASHRPVAAALLGLAPGGYLLIPLLLALPPVLGFDGVPAGIALASAAGGLAAACLLWRLRGAPGSPDPIPTGGSV